MITNPGGGGAKKGLFEEGVPTTGKNHEAIRRRQNRGGSRGAAKKKEGTEGNQSEDIPTGRKGARRKNDGDVQSSAPRKTSPRLRVQEEGDGSGAQSKASCSGTRGLRPTSGILLDADVEKRERTTAFTYVSTMPEICGLKEAARPSST